MFSYLHQPKGFYKHLFLLALPVIVQNLITTSLGFLDTFMVGLLGSDQMSAVTVANVPVFIIQLVVFGLQSGSSVLISQYWGRGDRESINRVMGIGFMIAGGVSVLFAAILCAFPAQVLYLITDNLTLVELAEPYLRIVGFSYIFNSLSSIYIGMQRSIENPRFGMIVFAISMLCNTLGNYVLIFGKLGLPALGITGAAVATLLSRVVEFVVAFSYAFRCRTMPLMKHAILRPGMDMLRKFLRYSAPVLINETLWGTGFSMITVIMGHMANSSDLIAAYTLAGNIDKLMTSGVFGIAAAVSVIVGKEIGTGNLKGVYNIGRALCFTAFAFGIVLGLAEYTMFVTLMRPFVMPLFSLSAVAERLCSVMLMCYACAIPLHSFSTTMVVGVLRGGGDVNASLVIDNFPLWCGTLPMMCLLGLVLKVPNEVFCLCLMIEYIIKSPLGLYRLHSGKWIHDITRIDRWFLARLQNLVDYETSIRSGLTPELYQRGKYLGYPDAALRRLSGSETLPPFRAGYKMVDTCAAEFDAQTPYFYASADTRCEARTFPRSGKPVVMVLGSGPIRIGQGIEFDYSSVHCVWTLKAMGYDVVIVNNNPETVSTDFDTGDRLYFDPLNPESVDNIIATEKPDACVVQFGGQTAIKLAKHMDEIGLPILGTPADAIDEAEDRERFDELLERCNIPRAPGRTVFNLDEALAAAEEIGLPVLMRPSYVLGGQNMIVAYNKADIIEYMGVITEHVDMDHPVLLDKYIMGTECEVDAICDGENFLIPGIMEQVERTGVHSGDSICVYPAQHLTQDEIDTMVDYTGRFARELHVTGLVNVQYAVSNGKVYVIEVNPRSSRTVPYISKVTGVPMVDLAVRCCLGEKLTDMGYGTGLHPNAPYVAVKVPVFSFEKLHGVDTQFGPEMKSTGEVLGIAPNFHDALLKGLIGAGYTFKTPGPASCCIFTVKDSDKPEFVDIAWKLKSMGYKLYGTSGTCAWLNKHMVPCNEVRPMSGESPNIVDLLQSGLVDYVFSTSAKGRDPKRDSVRLRRKAVELSIPCITAVDTANALVNCLRSDHSLENIPLVDIATLYHRK